MENTFEHFSDDQLLIFIAKNCPEGSLLNAVDELADRMLFYRTIVADLADQSGKSLEEFAEWLFDDEPDPESMSLEDLQAYYDDLVAEKKEEGRRQELIKKIKELTKE